MTLQLTEEDELRWDDGTANPEYCLDEFNLVGRVKFPSFAPLWLGSSIHRRNVCVCSGKPWVTLGLDWASLHWFMRLQNTTIRHQEYHM